jgi:putative transposase
MRYPASEKLEIIRLVEQSHLPVRRTLATLGILPGTFYRWYDRLQSGGPEALEDRSPRPRRVWNRIPDDIREQVLELALDEPALSPRELATRFTDLKKYFVSEASVYRLLKAHDLITSPAFIVLKAADAFKDKTTAPNQLWQTDFTYLKVIGWGWFYLSTVLDDFSRYIIAWKLCTTMKVEDVTDTLELALETSGIETARAVHRPRLLSDNGSSYLSADLAKWLDERRMQHVRGAPYHPMTQGKIERWHQTLKNRILLENYYLPGELEAKIGDFVAYYNHLRYHESIANLTPADVYFGRGQTILLERERIKRHTIESWYGVVHEPLHLLGFQVLSRDKGFAGIRGSSRGHSRRAECLRTRPGGCSRRRPGRRCGRSGDEARTVTVASRRTRAPPPRNTSPSPSAGDHRRRRGCARNTVSS